MTTIFNTETDTFSTTTTIIDQVLTTDTVSVTSTNTITQYSTNYPPTTTISPSEFFIPAQSAQASDRPINRRAKGAVAGGAVLPGRLQDRQVASASVNSNPASAYVYTEAVSCTGVMEYFSTTTKVVATATPSTTVLPVVTDTTSTTETTTITSSVLQTPASTTETISSTITTTSIAGTTTSTIDVATTTVIVQAPQQTFYSGCAANDYITQVQNNGGPINSLYGPEINLVFQPPEAVISETSAYTCCVACFTTYGSTCGSAAFNAANGQCLIYDGTQESSGNPFGGCNGFGVTLGYNTGGSSQSYTLLDGPCGTTVDFFGE